MLKKRELVTFMSLLLSVCVWAQSYTLSGKVVDSSGKPLVGATVLLKKSNTGTVSNVDGKFRLTGLVSGNYDLAISFIGFKTTTTSVLVNKDLRINVKLLENQLLTEEVFVYATRAGEKTPMTSTNVSNDEIESRNLGQDIPYLLSLTPSFVASSDAGTGVGYTGFRIRGTDANRINVTVNGIPMNDSESHGVWWVNMPDLASSIENVQIQRGVGTSTQGAAAFGASINMQTGASNKEAYSEYSSSAGSFNTYKNSVRVGTGLIKDHFAFDARLSKVTSDGFIDRASADLKSFFISGGYYGDKTIVKLNIFSGKEKTYQAWNGVPSVRLNNDLAGMKEYETNWLYSAKETQEMIDSDSRTYNFYTYDNEIDNYQQDHTQLLMSHQFNDKVNVNAALHHTYGRGYYEQFREGDDFADYKLSDVILSSDTISSTNLVRQKWLDNNFYGATASLNYIEDGLSVTFGGGWNQYDGSHFGKVIWAEYASNGAKDHEWYRGTGLKTDYNVYAKANYTLSDNLSLYGDVQYRGIDYTIEGFDDDLRDLTQSHTFNFVNPKFGAYYTINDNSNAYLSWAIGNREPSRSNFVDADPSGKQPVAETLYDWESGYSWATQTFAVGVNAYYMQYKNQLILTGEINDVGGAIMTNVDESYRAGIELMAGVQILENLNWDGNIAFSQNKIVDFTEYVDNWDTWGQDATNLGTTDIAFSPNVVFNSLLTFEPIQDFEVALISQYVGDQYIDNSSSDDRKLDAYFVNNLKLSYSVKPNFVEEVKFNLLLNNILSEEYETNAWIYSYALGGQRYKMDGYFPQAGLNFLLGVDIRF